MKMYYKIVYRAILLSIIFCFFGCKQLREIQTLTKCEFRLSTINILTIDNINVSQVKSISDLDFLTITRLGNALLAGRLPITYVANIEAFNPNSQKAAISKFLLHVLYNDTELLQSEINQYVEVMPGKKAMIPVQLTSDIGSIVKGQSIQSLIAVLLSGSEDVPSVFTVKMKPSLKVGPATVQYPGYITLTKDFKSK